MTEKSKEYSEKNLPEEIKGMDKTLCDSIKAKREDLRDKQIIIKHEPTKIQNT